MKIYIVFISFLFSCHTSTHFEEENLSRKKLREKIVHKKVLDYRTARKVLMGEIHLENSRKGPEIEDIYCLKKYSNRDIKSKYKIGRNRIPDHNVINVEHVWPKSRFFSKKRVKHSKEYEIREADLHILYPSSNYLNSERSSYQFGEVIDNGYETENFPCSNAQLGPASFQGKKLRDTFFEPPQKSKGNVARAMFYFSLRYNEPISYHEESFLRKWHEIDPPDEIEKRRNDIIERKQGNRNPFIDNPKLVDSIKDF